MEARQSINIRNWPWRSLPRRMVIALIRLYQKTRILREPSCRFYPSCSEYMARSIEANGLIKGIAQGIVRLAKCHPFHPGGVDEVVAREAQLKGKTNQRVEVRRSRRDDGAVIVDFRGKRRRGTAENAGSWSGSDMCREGSGRDVRGG